MNSAIVIILLAVIGLIKILISRKNTTSKSTHIPLNLEENSLIEKNKKDGKNLLITFFKEINCIYILIKIENNFFISKQNLSFEEIEKIKLDVITSESVSEIVHLKIINNEIIEIVTRGNNDNEKYTYFKFDLKGLIICKKIINENLHSVLIIRGNGFIETLFDDGSADTKTALISESNNEIIFLDFLNEDLYPEKDWGCYHYLEALTTTNKPNQLAVIVVHPYWQVDGIKIFNYFNNLELIYDLDDENLDGAIHDLTFNSKGDKFVALLYKYNESESKDFISILEFSTDNEKTYNKLIKTAIGYWDNRIEKVHYLTENLICIINCTDIYIFELDTNKNIQAIERDKLSPFYVTFNCLVYQFNKKLIYREF
ncbi:hypothetical protein [Flavobacterium sp.]|jgi:hypothetical protein|uniref:hypothetical protein n=1 Tax=Flavobacterium sp. TaxID=239 RepID=UPI0037BEC539